MIAVPIHNSHYNFYYTSTALSSSIISDTLDGNNFQALKGDKIRQITFYPLKISIWAGIQGFACLKYYSNISYVNSKVRN